MEQTEPTVQSFNLQSFILQYILEILLYLDF